MAPKEDPFLGSPKLVIKEPKDFLKITTDQRREEIAKIPNSPIGYNEVEGVIYNLATMTPATDQQLDSAQALIEQHFNGVALPDSKVAKFVTELAYTKSFNPIEDFYINLPEWDNQKRMTTFLQDVWGVKDSPYYQFVSTLLLLSIVARAEDTSKFVKQDIAFIFTSVMQGLAKSLFVKDLAAGNLSITTDAAFMLHTAQGRTKENKMLLARTLINEVPEFETVRGSEVDKIKSVITISEFSYRVPYSKANTVVPFHNTLIGTTNNPQILTDSTGNRRFLMIDVDQTYNQTYMRANIAQILAEAKNFWITNDRPPLTMPVISGLLGLVSADVAAETETMHALHSTFNPLKELFTAIADNDGDSLIDGFSDKLTDDVVRYGDDGQTVEYININAVRSVVMALAQGDTSADVNEILTEIQKPKAYRIEATKHLNKLGFFLKGTEGRISGSSKRGWYRRA